MKTLIIYDNAGVIYYRASGDVIETQGGVNFLWVEIPEGKNLVSVDTSTDPHTPVFEDVPQSKEEALEERINLLEAAMNEMLLG